MKDPVNWSFSVVSLGPQDQAACLCVLRHFKLRQFMLRYLFKIAALKHNNAAEMFKLNKARVTF